MNHLSLRTPAAMLILMAGFVLGQASQPTPLAPKHKAWIKDDVTLTNVAARNAARSVRTAQWDAARLSAQHKSWIENDADMLVTPLEREVFLSLESDGSRDRFIEEFWLQRDPTPGTPRNEIRSEHFRRMEFADRVFGGWRGKGGHASERGLVYVLLGSPREVQKIEEPELASIEVWTYQNNPALGGAGLVQLLFVVPKMGEEYKLYDPAADKPSLLLKASVRSDEPRLARIPTLPFDADRAWGQADKFGALALAAVIGPQFAESILKSRPGSRGETILEALGELSRRRTDDRYAKSFREGKALPEVGYAVHAVNSRAAARAYFEPDGSCVLHIAMTPDRVLLEGYSDLYTAGLRSSLRLEDGKGKTIFRRGKDIPVSLHRSELPAVAGKAFTLYEAVPIVPGPLVVRYRLENTVNKDYSVFEETLTVPAAGTPAMTKPLLGRRGMRIVPEAEAGPRAFRVGDIQIDPEAAGVFGVDEIIEVFVQLTGLSREIKAAGQFEAEVRGGSGAPHVLRKPLAGYADGNILAQLPGEGLALGSYEVETRLVDGAGQVLLKASCGLTIEASAPPASWVVAGTNPPPGDPYYGYARGSQTAERGDPAKAQKPLAEAWRAREDSIEFAVGYADALLAAGEAGPARDVLRRYDGKPDASFEYYEALGRAALAAGQMREAVDAYSKALLLRRNVPAILNALGDGRLALGDKAAAAEAWKRSLEVDPNQPDIVKKNEAIK